MCAMCTYGRPERIKFKRLPQSQPIDIFLKICDDYDCAFLFESIGNGERVKFSFIGFEPETIITVKNGVARVADEQFKTDDPLDVVKSLIGGLRLYNKKHRYIGGAVGYISYDAIRYWENLPNTSIDDINFPDIEMGLFNDGIIFDHWSGEAYYFYWNYNRYDDLLRKINSAPSIPTLALSTPKVNIERGCYDEIIERAKDYIFSGDIFHVVLSKRYTSSFNGGFQKFYLRLRRFNPSPYMYFLKMGNRFIIGSSPETLVRVEGKLIETYPIARTRPVTGNPERDSALEKELLSDPKEIAEHIMLLDLARNDIGKVSEFSTVRVKEFMKIYRYSHVQHMVSKVIGKLKRGYDCFDVLRAVFPSWYSFRCA